MKKRYIYTYKYFLNVFEHIFERDRFILFCNFNKYEINFNTWAVLFDFEKEFYGK